LFRVSAPLVDIVLNNGTLIIFLWQRFTRHAILTLDPPTEIDKLAPL